MRILIVHNYYQQPGGEDVVFANEVSLLRLHGHEVFEYTDDNDRIKEMHPLRAGLHAVWSMSSMRRFSRKLKDIYPDLVHFHNTFFMLSPSVYYACKELNLPVIHSLHNPRAICPSSTFYRNGRICDDCMGRLFAWPGILHACYRGSYLQTAAVAVMGAVHRRLRTWHRKIDAYIVFTEFYRRKFIEGGFPEDKIIVKPHFVAEDPQVRRNSSSNYALFIGRLSSEKGLTTLLRAWQEVKDIPLKIRGEGPMLNDIKGVIRENRLQSIEIVNRLPQKELIALIKGARFLISPSDGYYENFGLVIIESFACGVPVIVSGVGVMHELVEDKKTGLYFTAGDPSDLASKVKWAWEHEEEMRNMGERARQEFELKYTAQDNYQQLMRIYNIAIEKSRLK